MKHYYLFTVSCSYLLFVLLLSLYLVLFTSLLLLVLNIVFTVPSPLLIYRPLSFVLVFLSHLFTNLPSLVHTTNIFITVVGLVYLLYFSFIYYILVHTTNILVPCSWFSLSLIFFIHLLHLSILLIYWFLVVGLVYLSYFSFIYLLSLQPL